MFGHDYTKAEQDALDAVREREVWGSISPAGLHNDDVMYADSSKEIPNDIETIRHNLVEMDAITLRAENAKLREALSDIAEYKFENWDEDWVRIQCLKDVAREALLPAAPEEGE